MSKKSDDSIERIFRQALTQYDQAAFRESDWSKMEKMLEEEAGRRAAARSKRNRGIAYTLTGLTGLIIAVYFLAFKNPSDSTSGLDSSVNETQASADLSGKGNVKLETAEGLLSETTTGSSQQDQGGQDNAGQNKKQSGGDLKSNVEGTESQPGNAADKSDALEENGNTPKSAARRIHRSKLNKTSSTYAIQPTESDLNADPVQNPEHVSSNEQNLNTTSEVAATPASPANGAESDQQPDGRIGENKKGDNNNKGGQTGVNSLTGTIPAAEVAGVNKNTGQRANGFVSPSEKSTVGGDTSENIVSQNSISENNGSSSNVPSGKVSQVAAADTLSAHNAVAVGNQSDSTHGNTSQQEKQKVRPAFRWSVAALLAPEFSTTSLGSYSDPGASYGLRIGYQISNRFSVNTGILRSNKKYEGDGYDYTPRNPRYWQIRTNGVIPEEIDAECLVYELPVGVQFDAIQSRMSRLYVSATISSYFMISQKYDYTFESPNPGADMGWRSQSSETYWCSVGMLSAGYERYVHRSLAIGIEPYLKISLSEIGWPNIKLYSAGAYVTLRYRFMSQKLNEHSKF